MQLFGAVTDMFNHIFKLSNEEFTRMADPVKDRAKRAMWAQRMERDPSLAWKQEGYSHIWKYNVNHDINGRFDYKEAQKALIAIGSKSHVVIPIKEMVNAVGGAGYKPAPDTREKLKEVLGDDKGSAHIDLHHENGTARDSLIFDWAKMPSGKFEVNAYMAGGHAQSKAKKSSDFRGSNGVQPDGHIDPEADAAAKKFWAKHHAKKEVRIAPIGPKGTLERETEKLVPAVTTEPLIQERKLPKNPLKAAVFAQPATAVGPHVISTSPAATATVNS